MKLSEAKIAFVFDWMTTPGGAEKVNKVLHDMFPEAPIYTSLYNPQKLKGFESADIHTSFIQKFPFAKNKHQYYLSFMPYAYELFDLSDYDIVISSSHCCAKGIITKVETMHVSYCHAPMRYAWDKWQSYINDYKLNPILKRYAKKRIHKLRIWDRISAERVDHYIANSSTTQKRIKKYYNRDSDVIFPMIDSKSYQISNESKGYFLAGGRLTPYKRYDLIIETFNKIGLPLKIIGTGIAEQDLKKMAKSNIEFLGHVSDEQLKNLFSECEAYLFPQIEDFGIMPLEAMSSGRPVIAFKAGGALDTVIEDKTGIFFDEQNPKSFQTAIEKYQKHKKRFNPQEIQKHAQKFDKQNFKKNLIHFLEEKWDKWQKEMI